MKRSDQLMADSADWVSKFFLEKAELFLRVMESEPMLKRGEETAEAIAPYLEEKGLTGGRILEVGCGCGRVAVPLAKKGFEIVGVDISPLYIERAESRAKSEGVSERTKFLVADARYMAESLKDLAPFDAILFVWTSVIGYYDEKTDLQVLRQARSLAKEGSLLLILDTANQDWTAFFNTYLRSGDYFIDYGDFAVVEHHEYDPTTSRAKTKWLFYDKAGKDLRFVDEVEYEVRLYALHELVRIAQEAGWKFLEAFKNLKIRSPFVPVGPINAIFKAR